MIVQPPVTEGQFHIGRRHHPTVGGKLGETRPSVQDRKLGFHPQRQPWQRLKPEVIVKIGERPVRLGIFEEGIQIGVQVQPFMRLAVALGQQSVARSQPHDVPALQVIGRREALRRQGPRAGGKGQSVHLRIQRVEVVGGQHRPTHIRLDDMQQAVQPPRMVFQIPQVLGKLCRRLNPGAEVKPVGRGGRAVHRHVAGVAEADLGGQAESAPHRQWQ